MHIAQIDPLTTIFSIEVRGKWFCSDGQDGSDGHRVNRYLQADGSWGKNTYYFDTEAQVQTALQVGEKPDFTLSAQEMMDRADIRQDMLDFERDCHDFD